MHRNKIPYSISIKICRLFLPIMQIWVTNLRHLAAALVKFCSSPLTKFLQHSHTTMRVCDFMYYIYMTADYWVAKLLSILMV